MICATQGCPEGFSGEVTREPGMEGQKGIQPKRTSQGKGLEVGRALACLRVKRKAEGLG